MSNTFSLDDLRESVEKEFAPVRVNLSDTESVVLRNLLRLPKKDREKVFELMDAVEKAEGQDQASELEASGELALEVFLLVADDKALGKKLVTAIKDDLALTLKLFGSWMEATQPGEAERSPA
ncbi:phage tail assembly protein [Nocardia sp. NPDC055002]